MTDWPEKIPRLDLIDAPLFGGPFDGLWVWSARPPKNYTIHKYSVARVDPNTKKRSIQTRLVGIWKGKLEAVENDIRSHFTREYGQYCDLVNHKLLEAEFARRKAEYERQRIEWERSMQRSDAPAPPEKDHHV